MVDLARYMRIYDLAPADDAVSKREAALNSAVASLKKIADPRSLVELGTSVATAFQNETVPDPLGSTVAAALKKQSPAYVRDERELETVVVSAAAVLELISLRDTGGLFSRNDVICGTLWSSLENQPVLEDPKFEQLRQDVLMAARKRVTERAEVSRVRTVPLEISDAAEGDSAQISKALASAKEAVSALVANAALDREELDVLWWALGGRSPITKSSYSSMDPAACAVVRGIELGFQLRRLPGRTHLSLALSGVREVPAITLAELLERLGEQRDALTDSLPCRDVVEANSLAFPLLAAIISGDPGLDNRAASIEEWCSRAILEATLASVCAQPVKRL